KTEISPITLHDAIQISMNEAHVIATHAELYRQQPREVLVRRAVHRRRGDPDAQRIAVLDDDLVAARERLHLHVEHERVVSPVIRSEEHTSELQSRENLV